MSRPTKKMTLEERVEHVKDAAQVVANRYRLNPRSARVMERLYTGDTRHVLEDGSNTSLFEAAISKVVPSGTKIYIRTQPAPIGARKTIHILLP